MDTKHSQATHSPVLQENCPICMVCIQEPAETSGKGLSHLVALEPGPEAQETCVAHKAVLAWLRARLKDELKRSAPFAEDDARTLTLRFSRQPGKFPTVTVSGGLRLFTCSAELIISLAQDWNQGTGILKHGLDPQWTNMHLARRWVETCHQKHGNRCSNPYNVPPCRPAYLVDTELACIIESGNTAFDYVALSYRWGERKGFQTDLQSLGAVKAPGGLSKFAADIPPAVHHAMQVVRSIGERYLWVDALCLISDDKEHLAEQLQIMASIYALAKVTLVATDGDAWDGLYGIRGAPEAPSVPRNLPNVFNDPRDGTQFILRHLPMLRELYQRESVTSKYFQRGWTFQEMHLSQRLLLFVGQQVHWFCMCATWHEDDPGQIEVDAAALKPDWKIRKLNMLNGIPDFSEMRMLIRDFYGRGFSRPDDTLPGLTGLLTLLSSHAFVAGFVCALTETWFDAALMWQCNDSLRNNSRPIFQRRKAALEPSILPGAVLPSWSWIAWEGRSLNYLDDEEDFKLPLGLALDHNKYTTTPITTWFSQSTPSSNAEKRRIQSSPHHDQEAFDKYFQDWVAETYDPSKHDWKGHDDKIKVSKLIYSHPSLPGRYFWMPFPMRSAGPNTSTCIPKQDAYISCHTKRGRFGLVRSPANSPLQPGAEDGLAYNFGFKVIDGKGRTCGWLQLPCTDHEAVRLCSCHCSRKCMPCQYCEAHPLEIMVELVAVCQRRRSCPCWASAIDECVHGFKDFYGVLWVEWDGGVAYRKACGYVYKHMWEEHDLEDVDLILG